ncbi:F-box domain containing protein, partial [Parasponia andersonii]
EIYMAMRRRKSKRGFISDDDLAVEILIRLPDCKSEVNCSLVCKRWFSIINSVHFRNKKLQRHHGASPPCTILFRSHGFGRSISLPLYHYFTEESKILHRIGSSSSSSYLDFLPWDLVRIHSSFNDLLLLSRKLRQYCFMICNPFTKQWIELPLPHIPLTANVRGAGLVCYPIKPPPQQQQQQLPLKLNQYSFKVMVVWDRITYTGGMKIEIHLKTYCSETGKWSEEIFSLRDRMLNANTPVACNGLLYWLVGDINIETVDGIFAFNLSKFTNQDPNYIRFINFPSGLLQEKEGSFDIKVRLGLVRGRLRLSQLLITKRNGFVLKVWELNCDNNASYDDDGSSKRWTLVHDVRVKKWIDKRQFVIAFHPENGNVLYLLFNRLHIYQYDIGEEIMEKVGQLPDNVGGEGFCVGDIRTYALVHPLWPTPIPASQSASASKC